MKRLFWFLMLAGCLAGTGNLLAQTPARPVDPSQARPAIPVTPEALTPQLAKPASSTTPPASEPAPATTSSPYDVSIIADSSLKQVLQELAQAWADSQDSGPQVPVTLTNAGTLLAKVEAGPGTNWDVIISADVADVKELSSRGLLLPDSQRSLARNAVVIYGRKALVKDDDLEWFDLVGSEWKKVALGNPALVASGRVAKLALQKHDLMGEDRKGLYVYTQTESMALNVAQQEKAEAVFVYKTDVGKMSLSGFAIFPLKVEDAPPVFYTAAISRLAKNPGQAKSFIDFCASEAGRAIFAKYGFETN